MKINEFAVIDRQITIAIEIAASHCQHPAHRANKDSIIIMDAWRLLLL